MTAVFFFIFYPTDIILLQRENAIVSIEPVIKGPYLSELCLHKSEEEKKKIICSRVHLLCTEALDLKEGVCPSLSGSGSGVELQRYTFLEGQRSDGSWMQVKVFAHLHVTPRRWFRKRSGEEIQHFTRKMNL